VSALLLDEMYPPALAKRLRSEGHDVVAATAVEVGLGSRSDADVLAWALRNSHKLSECLGQLLREKKAPQPGEVHWLS